MEKVLLRVVKVFGVLVMGWANFTPIAHAYRTFADDPDVAAPAHWTGRSLTWEISTESSEAVDVGQLELAALAAFETLSAPCDSGVPFTSTYSGQTSTPASAGDGRNTIAIVPDWSLRGFPSGRGATTDVQLRRYEDGRVEIVEADIYLNTADYQFVGGSPSTGQLDWQAVITHEALHLLGFLHVCEPDGAGGAPLCSASAEQFMSSAVYPEYLGVSSRFLSRDDAIGLCTLYAPDGCTPTCSTGEVCEGGRCVRSITEEPCVSGVCPTGVCALYGPSIGRCVASGVFGAECTRGAECNFGVCLTSSLTEGSYCSNPCTTNAQCTSGDRCLPVEARAVCVPPQPVSGCSVGGPGRPSALWNIGFLLLALCFPRRRHA